MKRTCRIFPDEHPGMRQVFLSGGVQPDNSESASDTVRYGKYAETFLALKRRGT